MSTPISIPLTADAMPKQWYNLAADLPAMPSPLGPDGKPVNPAMMGAIFPMNIVEQEVSTQRWIDIPEPVRDLLLRWRPTPLKRAVALEQHLKTPARIWYKDESGAPAGSHKANTAVAQAWYNKQFGIKRLTTETGAGQWGSSLAFACSLIGLECQVYMVRISFDQKPFRKMMMGVWGAECIPSPSNRTKAGAKILSEHPDTPGSLAIAISEAVEAALSDPTGETRYTLGSVLNHVLLHQTIIGLEAKQQLAIAGVKNPDIVVGCAGGGSNFAGIAFPFVSDKIHGAKIEIIPAEPASCPTLTRGKYAYDLGDMSGMTPLMAMHTLGHTYIPPAIHAGGLRYHGMAPLVSKAAVEGLLAPRAVQQLECYQAAITWARTEGFIPAPETSHAIATVIQEAVKAREAATPKDILFCYSGHGLMDLAGYQKFLAGELSDYTMPEAHLQKTLGSIAGYPAVG